MQLNHNKQIYFTNEDEWKVVTLMYSQSRMQIHIKQIET